MAAFPTPAPHPRTFHLPYPLPVYPCVLCNLRCSLLQQARPPRLHPSTGTTYADILPGARVCTSTVVSWVLGGDGETEAQSYSDRGGGDTRLRHPLCLSTADVSVALGCVILSARHKASRCDCPFPPQSLLFLASSCFLPS